MADDHGKAGTGPDNLKQGARSEYLAFYAFSAIGPAWPVPRPEDIGLDVICNIGRPEEEKKGKVILAGPMYSSQVKSISAATKDKGIKIGERQALFWLRNMEIPLLLTLVDKPKQEISIYSTHNVNNMICRCFMTKESVVEPAVIYFRPDEPIADAEVTPGGDALVNLGGPILKFTVSQIEDAANLTLYRDVLEPWTQLERKNLALRHAGIPSYFAYSKWIMNEIPKVEDIILHSPFSIDYVASSKETIVNASIPVILYLHECMNHKIPKAKEQFDALCGFLRFCAGDVKSPQTRKALKDLTGI